MGSDTKKGGSLTGSLSSWRSKGSRGSKDNSKHVDGDSGHNGHGALGAGAAGAAAGTEAEHREHHDNDNSSSDGLVKEKGAKETKMQWAKRHLRKWWWAYLILLIILLAILLPILFKLIIPAIVNDIVGKQSLPVKGGSLSLVSPTQLQITLNTSLNTPLGVHIDPTALDLRETQDDNISPFLTLQFPAEHVNHRTDVIIPSQTVTINNETQLIDWFNSFFDHPTAELAVASALNIHLGKLDYHSHLKKTIKLQGLNYLNGFAVKDLSFQLPPGADGHNLKGHLNIPNSGVLTLGLGNLTFNLMSGKISLGTANLYNVVLPPGNNSVPFSGVFDFATLIPNLGAILDSQKDTLGSGNIYLNATGNASVVNGEHIKFVEEVLSTKSITFDIPLLTLVGDLLSGFLSGSGGGGSNSLLDIVGDVVGNKTLFGSLLDNWNGTSMPSSIPTAPPSTKRSLREPRPMAYNILRLGLRSGLKV